MSEINNEKKINWVGLFTIWFGGMVSVPSLLIGSMLIKGLTFYNTLLAGFIGFSVVCIFMCLESIAAFDTKKTTVQLASSSFGVTGANILVGLVVGISCMGWFGVQCNIAGSSFAKIMSIYFENVFSPKICSFIIGLLMMLTAVLGIKYLKYLNYIAVPAKILLLAFGVIISFQGKSFTIISSYTPPEQIAFLTAIGLSIGFISVGGVISPDYARFAKSKKDVIKGTILGLLPAGISLLGVGSMLAILQNTYDIVEIFSKFGYPFMALLILIVATWTTNVMNAYSSGLALNQLFHFPENKRYLSTIIAGVIGGGLAAIGILDKFMDFLMILTITVPPIAGVLISDYFVSKSFNPNTNQAFNWKGIVSWLFGVAVMLVMENPIKNVLGIVVSLISYYVFQLFFRNITKEKIEL